MSQEAARVIKYDWNERIDNYIASGVDRREALDIEIAAKVGDTGGPLWKRCDQCKKQSGPESFELKRCGGCHLVSFYLMPT